MTVREAIAEVRQITEALEESLLDMEQVLAVLEEAERQRSSDERELAVLRRQLQQLSRGRSGSSGPVPRPQHSAVPHPAPAPTPANAEPSPAERAGTEPGPGEPAAGDADVHRFEKGDDSEEQRASI